jgi:hypothetical protein
MLQLQLTILLIIYYYSTGQLSVCVTMLQLHVQLAILLTIYYYSAGQLSVCLTMLQLQLSILLTMLLLHYWTAVCLCDHASIAAGNPSNHATITVLDSCQSY